MELDQRTRVMTIVTTYIRLYRALITIVTPTVAAANLRYALQLYSVPTISIVERYKLDGIYYQLRSYVLITTSWLSNFVILSYQTSYRTRFRTTQKILHFWRNIGRSLIFLSIGLFNSTSYADLTLTEADSQRSPHQQKFARHNDYAKLVNTDIQSWQGQIEQQVLEQWHGLSGLASGSHRLNWPTSAFQQSHICQEPVQWQSHQPLQPGRIQLQIRCDNPFWQLNTSLILEQDRLVAVAKRDLRSDEPLNLADLHFVRMNIADLPRGYIAEDCQCESLQIRRLVKRGSVLNPAMLEPATIVERGQTITIRSRQPGMVIEMAGTALSDGHLQQKIRVRNNSSERVIWATIVSADRVEVH